MAASLDKQSAAMAHLAWRVTYEWDRAKSQQKTMYRMHEVFKDLTSSADYGCLADKRKETIFFLWDHTRKQTLAQNTIHGRWLDGTFYSDWGGLPEQYKRDDAMLKTLPCGHFWLDSKGQATTIRYFISSDCAAENGNHFPR